MIIPVQNGPRMCFSPTESLFMSPSLKLPCMTELITHLQIDFVNKITRSQQL